MRLGRSHILGIVGILLGSWRLEARPALGSDATQESTTPQGTPWKIPTNFRLTAPENPVTSLGATVKTVLMRTLEQKDLRDNLTKHQSTKGNASRERELFVAMAALRDPGLVGDQGTGHEQAIHQEIVQAFAQELARDSDLLSRLTSEVKFDVDLAALSPFGGSPVSSGQGQHELVREQCHPDSPQSSTTTLPTDTRVAGRDYALDAEAPQAKSHSKFRGSFQAKRFAGGNPDLLLTMAQDSGFYQADFHLGLARSVEHQVKVPLLASLSASRRFDGEGQVLKTSLSDLLLDPKGPQLNMHFDHTRQRFESEVVLKRDGYEFTLKGELPEGAQPWEQPTVLDQTTYSAGYKCSF